MGMGVRISLVLGCVLLSLSRILAVELGTTTYSLSFSVKKGEFERTKKDVEAALAAAKAANTGPALELLLRSALSKVSNSLEELASKQEAEAKIKEDAAKNDLLGGAVPFSNASLAVKPLKGTGVGKGGKGVKRVSLAEFAAATTEAGGGTLRKWLKSPLLITNGVGDQAKASRTWSADFLMSEALSATRLKYVTPAEAKKHLSFDQDPNQPQQQMEMQMVSFERYFVNCFNLRAKQDFRKKAGADTEHCEQTVPAAPLLRARGRRQQQQQKQQQGPAAATTTTNTTSAMMMTRARELTDTLLAPAVSGAFGWAAQFEAGKASLAAASAAHVAPKTLGLQSSSAMMTTSHSGSDHLSLDAGAVEAALLLGEGGGGSSPARAFVLGPAGSGEQLRQPNNGGVGFLDALVHGKRRWFFMSPEAFRRLRSKAEAAETLEPASAFVFFENQLEELREDVGLGSSKKKLLYLEALQQPGDVLLVPPGMVVTSLSVEDSLSFRQHAVATAADALARATQSVWEPGGGALPTNYRAMACFDGFSLEAAARALGGAEALLGGGAGGGYQAQIIQQVMSQMFGSKESLAFMQLSVLAECAGVLGAQALEKHKAATDEEGALSSSSSEPPPPEWAAATTPCRSVWEACASKLSKALPPSAKTAAWLPTTAEEAERAAAAAVLGGEEAAAEGAWLRGRTAGDEL